jgi:hypothetical protein
MEIQATVCTSDQGIFLATVFTQLLVGRKLFEFDSFVAVCAGKEHAFFFSSTSSH